MINIAFLFYRRNALYLSTDIVPILPENLKPTEGQCSLLYDRRYGQDPSPNVVVCSLAKTFIFGSWP